MCLHSQPLARVEVAIRHDSFRTAPSPENCQQQGAYSLWRVRFRKFIVTRREWVLGSELQWYVLHLRICIISPTYPLHPQSSAPDL